MWIKWKLSNFPWHLLLFLFHFQSNQISNLNRLLDVVEPFLRHLRGRAAQCDLLHFKLKWFNCVLVLARINTKWNVSLVLDSIITDSNRRRWPIVFLISHHFIKIKLSKTTGQGKKHDEKRFTFIRLNSSIYARLMWLQMGCLGRR